MSKIILLLLSFILIFTNAKADKDYFLMLKNKKVNVRYGPSFEYPIKYIYKKKFFPLKIIDKKENFRRVIDYKKNSGWVHISQLKKNSSLILLEEKFLFGKPSKFSKPLAKLEFGRLTFVKKCKGTWCKVKTGEFVGWVQKNNVWGY
tara:strand:- start:95 stop:535 length:441 start_codon:yes stop_codon:yes gene_type:complete